MYRPIIKFACCQLVLTFDRARATSAAPTYFKRLCHQASKQTYADGGIYHNNPIQVADVERKLLWPALKDCEPDIVLSLGTAYSSKQKGETKWRPVQKGLLSHGKYLSSLARDHVKTSMDSERTWTDFLRTKHPTPENRKRYVRINPRMNEFLPKLDEIDKMDILKEMTRLHLDSNPVMGSLAQRLVATCFYFDSGPVHQIANVDIYEVSGNLLLGQSTVPLSLTRSQAGSVAVSWRESRSQSSHTSSKGTP